MQTAPGRYAADAKDLLGNGPFVLTRWIHGASIVLEKNPRWHGLLHPGAPGTVYPTEGAPGDRERGWLDPQYVGVSVDGMKLASADAYEPERLLVALYATRISPSPLLASHYRRN